MKELNQLLPNLKFTYDTFNEKVEVLDLRFRFKNSMVITDLHTKNTNYGQYPHRHSLHPEHIKKSIIYSQAQRLNNIWSYEKGFNYSFWRIFRTNNQFGSRESWVCSKKE